jgi:hypothetical protein
MNYNILKFVDWINKEEINWSIISLNPNAISILEKNIDQDEINWKWLSKNPTAISLLEQNPEKIYWINLSSNPKAIHLLEQNPDKINWINLSKNPNAISLLEKNVNKIILSPSNNDLNIWVNCLFKNPNIFEPDYQAMSKERMKIIYQELMERAWHPSRVIKWIESDVDM